MGFAFTPDRPVIDSSLRDIFATIEQRFRKTALGSDKWYIAVCAALTGSTEPELCDQLYLYLISQPAYSTPSQRQQLVRRLRETLVKAVSIIGVCKPLESITAINQCEHDEDKDHTSTREGWRCDQANLDRSMGWMRKVYTGNTDATMGFFADHPDFVWISKQITYGLYLSDRQVLDDVDTQMVVLPGIMIQNLRRETHWHIRGTRRIGVSKDDTQAVWDSVQMIAKYLGMKLHKVPTVDEVDDI